MTKDPDCASPPCFACEMDEAYAGFLPRDELASAIRRLLALAEQATPADVLDREIRALLPRVADDRIHAALKRLLEPAE